MNKYQEALDRLNEHMEALEPYRVVGNTRYMETTDGDTTLIQELVDKQTPVTLRSDSEKDSPRCPNCDRWFPNRQEYCSKCGQRIDWEE